MNTSPATSDQPEASPIARLRALAPSRALTVAEAMRVAELQADRLLHLSGVTTVPVPLEVIERQRRVTLEYDFDMPSSLSGVSDWDEAARCWIITVNGSQPATRRRFTVFHEYKHILDHGRPALRASTNRRYWGHPAAEFIGDYFAGCALVPRALLRLSWAHGMRDAASLSMQFDVSERAIEVRLEQLGLTAANGRCGAWLAKNENPA